MKMWDAVLFYYFFCIISLNNMLLLSFLFLSFFIMLFKMGDIELGMHKVR